MSNTDLSALFREISGLRDTVATLTQGLSQMLEVQATHTAMLERILLASASPAEGDTSFGDLIGPLIGALDQQSALIGEIKVSVDHLSEHVGTAVSGAVADVLAQL